MCDIAQDHLLTGDEVTAEAEHADTRECKVQQQCCVKPSPSPLHDSLASKEPVSVASYVAMTSKLEGRDKLTKVRFSALAE
jgi:hypothetical protein